MRLYVEFLQHLKTGKIKSKQVYSTPTQTYLLIYLKRTYFYLLQVLFLILLEGTNFLYKKEQSDAVHSVSLLCDIIDHMTHCNAFITHFWYPGRANPARKSSISIYLLIYTQLTNFISVTYRTLKNPSILCSNPTVRLSLFVKLVLRY